MNQGKNKKSKKRLGKAHIKKNKKNLSTGYRWKGARASHYLGPEGQALEQSMGFFFKWNFVFR